MKEYKRLTKEECKDILLSLKNPLIVMHARPDGDTVGSAMALKTLFSLLGKNASLICSDPIPERLRFILGDTELSEYEEGMDVVTIDVASRAQMGRLADIVGETKLMIDHHSTGEAYAPSFCIPDCSSASEALMEVVDLLVDEGRITLTPELAKHLYTAISSDTGCFRYSSANAEVHRIAARLIETGIDFSAINHSLFDSKSKHQLLAESFVAGRIETALGGKVAYCTVTRAERDALGVPFSEFETGIDVVRSLLGVEIAFIIKENDLGEFRTSIRSTEKDVAQIAKSFGGGGHTLAAGCTPKAKDIAQAKESVLSAILASFEKG